MKKTQTPSLTKKLGQVTAVIGAQWGDEGKGKLVDLLAQEYPIVVRATGGANAGHTIYVTDKKTKENKKYVFHLIPAGMLHPKAICVMGNGMVVNLKTLLEEVEILEKAGIKVDGRLLISDRVHLATDYHKAIDLRQEELKGAGKVGTTGRGIGPAYADKISRIGLRAGELLDFKTFTTHYLNNLEAHTAMYGISHDGTAELVELQKLAKRFAPMVTDTSVFIADCLKKKKAILLEGANGTLLDIDHGTYPFVTSSNASIGGIISGTGLPPQALNSTIGIVKAYMTRVGSGPFPTELNNDLGEAIRKKGSEFGATTGRPRRCGWFDAVATSYSVRVNGLTGVNLTKLDILSDLKEILVGVAYSYKGKKTTNFPASIEMLNGVEIVYKKFPGWKSDITGVTDFKKLPLKCQKYVLALEKMIGCKIQFIGTGPNRDQMIVR